MMFGELLGGLRGLACGSLHELNMFFVLFLCCF